MKMMYHITHQDEYTRKEIIVRVEEVILKRNLSYFPGVNVNLSRGFANSISQKVKYGVTVYLSNSIKAYAQEK